VKRSESSRRALDFSYVVGKFLMPGTTMFPYRWKLRGLRRVMEDHWGAENLIFLFQEEDLAYIREGINAG
jgi:hypothetical protein